MPPKRTAIPMLPWVTRGGQLTDHTRGVVFGRGSPVQDIADSVGMTPKGVRHSISISEGIVNGVRDEAIPSAPTTPSPKKKEFAQPGRSSLRMNLCSTVQTLRAEVAPQE